MTPNGDGYFFSATKDTITVLKGAELIGRFPASAPVIVDGESIVISSDGIIKRFPVSGFDTAYNVDDVISTEKIINSCDYIRMLIEEIYGRSVIGTPVCINTSDASKLTSDDPATICSANKVFYSENMSFKNAADIELKNYDGAGFFVVIDVHCDTIDERANMHGNIFQCISAGFTSFHLEARQYELEPAV